MLDGIAARGQSIGNQGAMTAPRNSFSTHARNSLPSRYRQYCLQRVCKLRRLHVVCVAAKGFVRDPVLREFSRGFRNPPRALMCPYPSPAGRRCFSIASRLYCGLCRNFGLVPTSRSSVTPCVLSISIKASIGRGGVPNGADKWLLHTCIVGLSLIPVAEPAAVPRMGRA